MYISNYHKKTIYFLTLKYNNILKDKDFEFNYYVLNYSHYSIYRELEKYIKKLNIEYNNKYFKITNRYKEWVYNKCISLHQKLYYKIKKINFELT